MGGEHDLDAEADINEEDFLLIAPHRLSKMTTQTATGLLRREDEIAAAKKKGRRRQADV